MKQLHVVCDLQWGSCGKGLFSGFLAHRLQPDTLITAWGGNSGHTYMGEDGVPHVNIMLPSGIVSRSVKQILIGPGSAIDPGRMLEEMARYGVKHRVTAQPEVLIHEHAAVVSGVHREAEAAYGAGIGSTMKGVGAAVIQKIKRDVSASLNIARTALKGTPLEPHVISVQEYNQRLDAADVAILEGAQGFSLSINQGMYPYTTSRDCTTHQLLSDCGIPRACWNPGKDQPEAGSRLRYQTRVYGVARTFPIRVSNRYATCTTCGMGDPNCKGCDGTGRRMIGTSGPCYPDQHEIQWADIGREPELTTVTKLPRRLFTFSAQQIQQAVRMNGVDSVFLNFANYLEGKNGVLDKMVELIEHCGPPVNWLGWGAKVNEIEERA